MVKILGRKKPIVGVVWDGTNLDEIKEFVGSNYNVYFPEGCCTTLIIQNEKLNIHLEVLIGWYIILEECINNLSEVDYVINCAPQKIISYIYDIIE